MVAAVHFIVTCYVLLVHALFIAGICALLTQELCQESAAVLDSLRITHHVRILHTYVAYLDHM